MVAEVLEAITEVELLVLVVVKVALLAERSVYPHGAEGQDTTEPVAAAGLVAAAEAALVVLVVLVLVRQAEVVAYLIFKVPLKEILWEVEAAGVVIVTRQDLMPNLAEAVVVLDITAVSTLGVMAEVQYLGLAVEVAAAGLVLEAWKLLAGMAVPGVVMP